MTPLAWLPAAITYCLFVWLVVRFVAGGRE
jgi:hypothetical protein